MSETVPDNSSLNDIEVTIRFGVGSTTASLEEISSIKPGYVFETGMQADQPVVIELNGAVLGYGELVQIGDRLGVRVKEYSGNGK